MTEPAARPSPGIVIPREQIVIGRAEPKDTAAPHDAHDGSHDPTRARREHE